MQVASTHKTAVIPSKKPLNLIDANKTFQLACYNKPTIQEWKQHLSLTDRQGNAGKWPNTSI